MITKYEKANRGKLLVAVMALAVVLAGAAVIFSDSEVNAADATVDYGTPTDIDQAAFDKLISNGVVTLSGNTTWNLKGNVVSNNVTIDLNGKNLKITTSGAYTASFAYDGTTDGSVIKNSDTAATLCIDAATVTLEDKAVSSWVIDGINGINVTVQNNATLNVVKNVENTVGVLYRTGTGNCTMTVDKSTVNFTSEGYGIQALNLVATNNAKINANLGDATLSVYATVKDSTVRASNLGLYAANITGDSSVEAEQNLGLYTGNTGPVFSNAGYSLNTVSVGKGSALTANTIINDISSAGSSSGMGSNAAKITGDGEISGNFSSIEGKTAAKYAVSDVTFVNTSSVSTGVNMTLTGATIGENAYVNVLGTVSGSVTNNGTIAVSDAKANIASLSIAAGSTGNVNTDAISNDAYLGGTIDSTSTQTSFGIGQVVHIVDDLVITKGAVITISGTLMIPADMTVTIEDGGKLVLNGTGAKIQNDGTIVVESAITGDKDAGLLVPANTTLNNNGTITSAYEGSDSGAAVRILGTLNNNGTFTIANEDNNRVAITDNAVVNNNAEGTFEVYGTLSMGNCTFINSGTLVIDGTINNYGNGTISIASVDSVVSIVSFDGNNGLTINDNAMKTGVDGEAFTNVDNSVTITPSANYEVRGLSISESIVTKENAKDPSETDYYKMMDISGSISYYNNGEGTTSTSVVSIYVSGTGVTVSGELTVNDFTTLTVNKSSTLSVSGTVNVTSKANMANNGTIDVSGEIILVEVDITGTDGTINAAKYVVTVLNPASKTTHYTTVEKAIAAGATDITVTGDVKITEDVTVPAKTTITQEKGTITIGTDAIVTVAADGKINQKAGTIEVDGTLYVENKKTGIKATTINSDVKSEGETDVRYTNLPQAIADANEGDVITLNDNTVDVKNALTVKSGVTVKIESGKTLNVIGTTITIDGTVYVNGGTFAVTDNGKSIGKVVLNGAITSDSYKSYDNKTYPAGAYYSITDKGKQTYYITPVEDAAAIISTVYNSTVTINGKVSVSDVSFAGTADKIATVVVKNEFTAGTITIDNAIVNIDATATFTGKISNGVGTVNIAGITSNVITVSANTEDSTSALTISGEAGAIADKDKYVLTLSGEVSIDDLDVPKAVIDGTATVTESSTVGDIIVNGTLNIDANKTLNVTGSATVLGTLAAATGTAGEGSAEINSLYVGVSADDVVKDLAAAATVSGKVTATTAYVAAGSTVPESITNVSGNSSTGFYIDDSLWMTVYGNTATVTNAPVENARFDGWVDPETKQDVSGVNITLSLYDRLDAKVDYKIYDVTVTADDGIGSVAIDGVVLQKYGNQYLITDLTAGQHTLSFQFKTGYEGTVAMTVDGTAASGYTFTLSGTEGLTEKQNVQVSISLTGATPIDYSQGGSTGGDDGLGIVEILLIILVVVVVILAIFVVLRMMRS